MAHYDITVGGSKLVLRAEEVAVWHRERARALVIPRTTIDQAAQAADRAILKRRLAA